jgi:putative nucleotidyltransferase with HDIG domain
VMRIATGLARRLLPLSALLRLSLGFPDSTPSRMRVAMRVTSESRLREIAEHTRANGFPTEPSLAAERILELVAALSYHDHLTRGHAERVRAFCGLIAAEMGFDEAERDHLRWAGLLHDIGKLGVPTEILNKPGRLTDDEFEVIKSHPAQGARMLEPLRSWLGDAVDAAGQHHERPDGTGYPRGLAGEQIVQSARIVSVADVFDVITSTRSYKEPSSAADAREEIARYAGTQFDPEVVRAFLAIPLARLRRGIGLLGLLVELPVLGAVPAATGAVGATVGALSTAAVVSVVAVAAVEPATNEPVQIATPDATTTVPGAEANGGDGGGGAAGEDPDGELGFTPEGTPVTASDGTPVTVRAVTSGTTIPAVHVTTPDTSGVTVSVPGSPTTTSVTVPGGGTTTPTLIDPTTITAPTSVPITLPITTTTLTIPTTVTVPTTPPTLIPPITTTTITVPTTLPITLP